MTVVVIVAVVVLVLVDAAATVIVLVAEVVSMFFVVVETVIAIVVVVVVVVVAVVAAVVIVKLTSQYSVVPIYVGFLPCLLLLFFVSYWLLQLLMIEILHDLLYIYIHQTTMLHNALRFWYEKGYGCFLSSDALQEE